MTPKEAAELEKYLENRFMRQAEPDIIHDDGLIGQWEDWIQAAVIKGAGEVLNETICSQRPAKFASPEDIAIEIYPSPAGKVPVIVFGNASDFECFIVNLIYKGERPEDISQMGASFIFGKRQRFLVLSKKYYSNTPPEYVGLSSEEWREKSMIIRREHECTHYYTKKYYGSASNNLHDELIADFCGIYEAFGRYEGRLFRHFMGIDGTHDGRLSLYTRGMSDGVREIIADIACRCSEVLEEWTKTGTFIRMDKTSRINFLCETNIKDLADMKL